MERRGLGVRYRNELRVDLTPSCSFEAEENL